MQFTRMSKGIVSKAPAKTLTLLVCFLVPAACLFAQTITLSLKDQPIETAFKGIEAQTTLRFIYSEETIHGANPVSVQLVKVPLQDALQKVFADQPLSYSVEDGYIMVKKKEVALSAPVFEVSGNVTDEDGRPLAGVTVMDKRSLKSTFTANNGEFVLKGINENSTLVFSYVGRETVEVPLAGKNRIAIHLQTISKTLDETIIQAYGTTTRRLNTGNIAKVNGAEIVRQPVSNVLMALEGRVAGMVVTQSTGLPGSSVKVQLRGRTTIDPSITDDQPLFVIDGVPFAPNNNFLNSLTSALGRPSNSLATSNPGGLSPLALINPQDIESVEILKDADATAIYGSRGANGVILITTKKGKSGKTLFSFNIQQGISEVTRTADFLTTPAYLAIRKEAFKNDGIAPTNSNAYDLLLWDTTRYTDFTQMLIGRRASSTDLQASVSGGTSTTTFLVGGNYDSQTTVFPGDLGDRRGGIHFSGSQGSSSQKFKALLTGSYSSVVSDLVTTDLTSIVKSPPNLQVYDSSGKLAWNEGGLISGYNNPLAYLYQKYQVNTDNLLSNLQLSYELTKSLNLKVSGGYNTVQVSEVQTNPAVSQNPLQNPFRSASFVTGSFKSWIVEPQLNYRQKLLNGTLHLLLGGTWQDQATTRTTTSGSGYIDDALLESLSGASSISAGRSFTQYRYEAGFGRVNYDLQEKYLLNFSARRDGSSRFGPKKQFSWFGAAGAAWVFSKERFFSETFPILSFGKLRGSVGTTGNDKIGDYLFLNTWTSSFDPYQGSPALSPSRLFNPDFHWEKTTKIEGAVDLGFLNDRILLTAAYYRNRSSDQLVQYKVPAATGFSNVIRNLPALVQNSGLEITFTSVNVKTAVLKWSTSINFTAPGNKLVSFPGLATSSYASQYVVGEPLNLIYKYKNTGVDPATGLFTVLDLNKDNLLRTNDYLVLGNLDPKFFAGLGNSLQWKGFALDVFIQLVNQTGRNYLSQQFFVAGTINNFPVELLSRWQNPGDITGVQRFSSLSFGPANTALNNFKSSNGVYSDASYARLKNVSLSYELSPACMQKIGFSSCRFYLLGQNLLTVTNYKAGDPETQNYLRLPPLKTVAGGIAFSF